MIENKKNFITLGIETSCDETSAAVLRGENTLLSNVIATQIPIHTAYGGVVPEIASRHHLENINRVVEEAMAEAKIQWEDVDLIGVTHGPGLSGALVIGVGTAKAYSLATGIPLVGVNHMYGHIDAVYAENPDLKPPFMALIVSGGHTNIVKVTEAEGFHVLGSTRDDAIGEAYDKVARILGLGYPGGPKVDKMAREGRSDAIEFKRTWLEKGSYDFSFSGIKTGVLNYVNRQKQLGKEIDIADIAASFQEAVVDVVVTKTMVAVKGEKMDKLVLAGGVASNSRIREAFAKECKRDGVQLFIPPAKMCTDNGGMIAIAAYQRYKKFGEDDLLLDAISGLEI